MADPGDIFAKQRERIQSQAGAQEQQAREAIKRRFAALGGLQSGAGIKAEEEAAKNIREAAGAQADALAVPEAQFQFQKEQAAQQQANFGENLALQKQQAGLQKDIFDFQKGTKMQEIEMAQNAFKAEREDQAFNKALSAVQAGVPFDLGKYLASIGFNVNSFR